MKWEYIVLILLILGAITQTKELTSTDIQGFNRISGSVLSPNGEYAVYSVKKWNKETGKSETNIRYINIKTKETLFLTEPVEGQSDSNPSFSLSFQDFIFFTRVTDGEGALYYLPFPSVSTEPKQLAKYPVAMNDFKIGGTSLVFSADVYFECKTLECSAEKISIEKKATWQGYDSLLMFHWDKWLPQGKGSHLFIQTLEYNDKTKEISLKPDSLIDITAGMELNTPPLFTDSSNYDVSRDGTAISFSAHLRTREEAWVTGWKTYYYSVEAKNPILITGHTQARTQMPKFSKDGTRIAYLAMKTPMLESENLHFEIYNILTNKIQIIDDELDRSVSSYVWIDDENLFFRATDMAAECIFKLNIKYNQKPKFIKWLVGDTAFSYGIPIFGLKNSHFAIASKIGYKSPEDLVVFDLNNIGKEEYVTELNKDNMKEFEFVEPISFMFEGGYKDQVQGWIFKPAGYVEGKQYSTALLIHGGPESSWSSGFSYGWNPQLWANHGFTVVMINPHGSTGRGSKFQNAVRNDWGGVPYQDIMAGIDYAAKTYNYVNKDKMCAIGGSYGGYMVNWIQGHTDIFKCLISHDGAFSTISKFYSTDELWFQKSEFCTPDKIGCNPFDSPEIREGYEKNSPERYVENWKTPMLVIHGGMDYRVPLTEALSAFTSLQLKKVDSRLLFFPLENHWVLRPENSNKWYEEIFAWMDKYLTKE